jgi:hypothetical protein
MPLRTGSQHRAKAIDGITPGNGEGQRQRAQSRMTCIRPEMTNVTARGDAWEASDCHARHEYA